MKEITLQNISKIQMPVLISKEMGSFQVNPLWIKMGLIAL